MIFNIYVYIMYYLCVLLDKFKTQIYGGPVIYSEPDIEANNYKKWLLGDNSTKYYSNKYYIESFYKSFGYKNTDKFKKTLL